MDKSDNAEMSCKRVVTRIHFVDGSIVAVKGSVINRFPYMSGDVGFLQLEGRTVVNLNNVKYMEVANDDEE